jgi:hypothetical protein
VGLLDRGQNLVGAGDENLAGFGEADPAAMWFEEIDSGFALEPFELLGDRRRRE